jgi:hypothetical protein
MCSIFGLRFKDKSDRDVRQNAVNERTKLEQNIDQTFEAWRSKNPNGTWESFEKDTSEISYKGESSKTVTVTPTQLVKCLEQIEGVVVTAGARGHWSLAAVGVIGGMLFLGAFLALVFVAMPVLLPILPALGCAAAFITASVLHTTLCAAGSFLVGLFIFGIFHGAIYPYASGSAVLPEEKKPEPEHQED